MAYFHRERDFSARVDIYILSWRLACPGYFPPSPPGENDAGHSSISQQQLDNWVDRHHGSTSSSSNNAPSEPTIDLSSWSPRSYTMLTHSILPHSPLITYPAPSISNKNPSTHLKLTHLHGSATADLIYLGNPTQMRPLMTISLLNIQSPIKLMATLLKTLRTPELERGDSRGSPAIAFIYSDLPPTQLRRGRERISRDPSYTNLAEISRNVFSTEDIRSPDTPQILTADTAQLDRAQNDENQPGLLPHPTQGGNQCFRPNPQRSLSSNGNLQLLQSPPTQNAAVHQVFAAKDLFSPTNMSSPQVIQIQSQQTSLPNMPPPKIKPQATRRSERLQKRKSSTIMPLHSVKNKTSKGKIAFDLDSSSHHSPFQVDAVLQILQASGMQITQNTEQLIQEAIDQDQQTSPTDNPRPTTPLHDVIPPLALPGAEILL